MSSLLPCKCGRCFPAQRWLSLTALPADFTSNLLSLSSTAESCKCHYRFVTIVISGSIRCFPSFTCCLEKMGSCWCSEQKLYLWNIQGHKPLQVSSCLKGVRQARRKLIIHHLCFVVEELIYLTRVPHPDPKRIFSPWCNSAVSNWKIHLCLRSGC